jgi:endonuclease/exonuclease/phosphatase (EEP) superfamily protein YafD
LGPAGLLDAAGALACGLTLAGFLGPLAWFVDLTSHFRPQYAALLVLASAVAMLRRKGPLALTFGAFAVLNLAVILVCTGLPRHIDETHPPLRVVLLNVHTANRSFDRVREYLREANPHVVVLEEVDARWMEELAELRDLFPHEVSSPRGDNFGIAILSQLPLRDASVVELGKARLPSMIARVEFFGGLVTLLGTHPLPPVGSNNTKLRNEQLSAVASFAARLEAPVVLLGDLNLTPWCSEFRRLLRASKLHNGSAGLGLHATWPARLWPLRIPIDHCLISADLRVARKEVGSHVGSDHLPLLVELTLAERR